MKRALLCIAILASALTVAAPPAGADNPGKPDAVVSLGDSFMSGEGGRWNGNSNDGLDPDRDGTDRAYRTGWWWSWWYDTGAVYPASDTNGCHRSDVSELQSSGIPMTKINLACSGAETEHIFRASSGGQTFKGESPQADQLAAVAAGYDIELVVMSIGGNDLGFADVITACVTAWTTNAAPCNTAQQAAIDAAMPTAMADLGTAIDEVRAALASAGDTEFRFVIQSAPSPIPRASENRYPETGWSRLSTGGCPMWNADADWARDTLVHQIDANMAAVADAKGVEFLSLADAFQGKEACSTGSSLVQGDWDTPNSSEHEWVRFLVSGAVQGDLQESMHPNAFGQQALGTCLSMMWNATPGDYACTNTGGDATAMNLTAIT